MIERWIYSLSGVLTLQMFFFIAAGLLAALFLYWLIRYQFCLMCPQIKRIKRLSRFVGDYKGIKMELVAALKKEMQGKVNQTVWQEYEAAMLARRPAAVRSYFTYARIYDIPCRRESAVCYKWYTLVLGLALGIFGWVLIKVGGRLTLLEALYSDNFVYILQQELIEAKLLPADFDFEAHKELVPMQPGDVPVTYADTKALERDFGFKPNTSLKQGLHEFVKWYKDFYM